MRTEDIVPEKQECQLLSCGADVFFIIHSTGRGSKREGVGGLDTQKDNRCLGVVCSCASLSQTRVTREGGALIEEFPLSHWPIGSSVEHFLD